MQPKNERRSEAGSDQRAASGGAGSEADGDAASGVGSNLHRRGKSGRGSASGASTGAAPSAASGLAADAASFESRPTPTKSAAARVRAKQEPPTSTASAAGSTDGVLATAAVAKSRLLGTPVDKEYTKLHQKVRGATTFVSTKDSKQPHKRHVLFCYTSRCVPR